MIFIDPAEGRGGPLFSEVANDFLRNLIASSMIFTAILPGTRDIPEFSLNGMCSFSFHRPTMELFCFPVGESESLLKCFLDPD